MSLLPDISFSLRLRRFLSFGAPKFFTMVWVVGGIVIGVLVACTALNLSHKYNTERAKTELVAWQLQQAQAERDRKAGYYKYLNSPEGKIAIAIEHGWVNKGDNAVSFSPQPPVSAGAPVVPITEKTTLGGLVLAALTLFVIPFIIIIGIVLLIYRWRARRTPRQPGSLTPRSELNRRPAHW